MKGDLFQINVNSRSAVFFYENKYIIYNKIFVPFLMLIPETEVTTVCTEAMNIFVSIP